MGTTVNKRRVVLMLTQDSDFPYVTTVDCTGMSIINTGSSGMVVEANGLVIPVPQNTSWDGDLGKFRLIDVTTASNSFAIEVRG